MLLALFISALPTDLVYRSAGIFSVLVVSLALQHQFNPFKSKSTNILESANLIITTVTYATMASLDTTVDTSDDQVSVLAIFVLALNLIFVVAAVSVILWPFIQVKFELHSFHFKKR